MTQRKEEIVAIGAVRSPMGKFGGTLRDLPVYELGSHAIREATHRARLTAEHVDEVIFGCCRHAGNGTNPARTAARLAGLRPETPATTITMACASGMRAVIIGLQAILVGDASVVVSGGMESMSTIPYLLVGARWKGFRQGHQVLLDGWHDSRDPFLPEGRAGLIIEKLVAKHLLLRKEQDEWAFESYRRAKTSRDQGLFDEEISPIQSHKLSQDETIREDSSIEKLVSLKPAFSEDGSLTAGNSSTFADGAAAIVLTSRKKADELGIKPLFSILSYASGAVENSDMGEGPSLFLTQALRKASMRLSDLDFVEINEAFAAVAIANERLLGLDRGKMNKKGGAIALGHPVGASGARILVTLYYTLKHFNKEVGGAAIGAVGGVGTAILIKREQ